MEGLSGRISVGANASSGFAVLAADAARSSGASLTSPTKRNPLRARVRTKRCSSPLSPIALRTALMWLVSVDSETMRPVRIQKRILADDVLAVLHEVEQEIETFGPIATTSVFRVSSRRSGSSAKSSNRYCTYALRRPGAWPYQSGQALDITAGHCGHRPFAQRPKAAWTNIQGKSNAKTRSSQS